MSLAPGTRLGPYEVSAPLGSGGMGEVYRARDGRLGRDVAIKVLPAHLSAEPEVRARFEREARTVAGLNHPHICVVHDVGREGDTDFLVMELVDGTTLAERLARGPLPLAEVIRLGGQIADALERAHRAGVIHRDLKPGNVMLARSGAGPLNAKLMDFGLARATGLAGPAAGSGTTVAGLTQSPTVAPPLTAEGTLVGTFQYMAPEQLEGREADARSDIWALGCVLYEMTTGRRAFEGKSQASLISAIMSGQPVPLSALAPLTPLAFDRVVQTCLAKDPDERWQTAHDIRLQLRWVGDGGPGSTAGGASAAVSAPPAAAAPDAGAAAPRPGRGLHPAALLAALLLAAAAGFGGARWLQPPPPAPPLRRFAITAPRNAVISSDPVMNAISPDGRMLLFGASDSAGGSRLWVRSLDALEPRPLPGSEGGSLPFWAPDGRSVAFFGGQALQRLDLAGGKPEALAPVRAARGGAWSPRGFIVYAPDPASGLLRVSETGGQPTPVTTLDAARGQTGHRWPQFLPDGRHFLYVAMPARDRQYDVFVGSVDGGPGRFILAAGSVPVYAPPGFLIYSRNGTLVARKFDAERLTLTGEPIPLGEAPPPSGYTACAPASASATGVLAEISPDQPNTELHWYDRAGRRTGTVPLPAGRWQQVDISPDGRRVCVSRNDSWSSTDLWLFDLANTVPSRFTFGPGTNDTQVWTPDGQATIFASDRSGTQDVYRKPVDGSSPETPLLTGGASFKWPTSVAPDGRSLFLEQSDATLGWTSFILPLDGSGAVRLWQKSDALIRRPYISPDGRWMAYLRQVGNRGEVFIESYPTPGNLRQASTDGAIDIVGWTKGGAELVFVKHSGGALMAVDVRTNPTLDVGAPHALFDHPNYRANSKARLDITPDGERILMAEPPDGTPPPSVILIENWTAALGKS